MDRERAEAHLRLLAEEELRRAVTDARDGASPHIPSGCVVGPLKHHPARRKAQRPRPVCGSLPKTRVGTRDRPAAGHFATEGKTSPMSTPTTTEQDNLRSRLPDPSQFVPEVADISGAMFKATLNGSIPQTIIISTAAGGGGEGPGVEQ
jgi:hypothetical protein